MINFFIVITLVILFATSIGALRRIFTLYEDSKLAAIFIYFSKYNVLIIAVILFSYVVYGVSASSYFKNVLGYIKENQLGQIGDLINGLVSPIVSIISIYILYKAFEVQFEANQQLAHFEDRKGVKDDLDWLRDNSKSFAQKANLILKISTDHELKIKLETNSVVLGEISYILSVFFEIDRKISENRKNKGLVQYKSDLERILFTFYLTDIKRIFNKLDNFCNNNIDWETIWVLNDFFEKFDQCYNRLASEIDSEKVFKNTLKNATFKKK